jgi:aconitate hydratase
MGVLPLQFMPGHSAASLGLTGHEEFDVVGLSAGLSQRQQVKLRVRDGKTERMIDAMCRLDGPVELEYYRHGGIIPAVLRRLAASNGTSAPNGSDMTRGAKVRGKRS